MELISWLHPDLEGVCWCRYGVGRSALMVIRIDCCRCGPGCWCERFEVEVDEWLDVGFGHQN